MGELFEKADYNSQSDGDIDNLLNPLGGWRLPTMNEWEAIINGPRTGSEYVYLNESEEEETVSGARYCFAIIGSAWRENFIYSIMILFPDGATVTGRELLNINVNTPNEDDDIPNEDLTLEELNGYLAQGCAILPSIYYYIGDDEWHDEATVYWSNSTSDTFWFQDWGNIFFSGSYRLSGCSPARLVK